MTEYYATSDDSNIIHISPDCSHLSNASDIVAYLGVPDGKRLCFRCDPEVEPYHDG